MYYNSEWIFTKLKFLMHLIDSETLSITTDFWWHVTPNTLAYFPLTSSSTINDISWNNKNLTNSWNVSFWTYQWIDCAYFSWNNYLYNNSFWTNQRSLTVSWFMYFVNFSSGYDKNIFRWWNNLWPRIESNQNILHCSPWLQQSISVQSNSKWIHYVFTYDWNGTLKFYVNATLIWTNSTASPPSSSWISISRSYQSNYSFFKWWQSEIIIEDYTRSQEQITKYFNKMKSKYWIS